MAERRVGSLTPETAASETHIGLMCGTFDPPHLGHLLLAETLRLELALDKVLFVPVGEPPHKPAGVTAVAQRLTMTQLAIADNPCFMLDTTDIDRPPPHFTYTLIPALQKRYPQAMLWLLVGSDSLNDLPTWKEPLQLLQHCRLGVLLRPGHPVEWARLEAALPGLRSQVDVFGGVGMRVSSTWLRERLAIGEGVRYLLPEQVAAYIETQRLYGA